MLISAAFTVFIIYLVYVSTDFTLWIADPELLKTINIVPGFSQEFMYVYGKYKWMQICLNKDSAKEQRHLSSQVVFCLLRCTATSSVFSVFAVYLRGNSCS